MVRNSSVGKVISGNGKGEVSGFGACWAMGACAFSCIFNMALYRCINAAYLPSILKCVSLHNYGNNYVDIYLL
jgi:hypothetical protein